MLLLRRLSAAASGRLRRGLSTVASKPPWAMIQYIKIRESSAQRASIELAQPPVVSNLVVPEHLVGLDPPPPLDPDSDIIGALIGDACATSGDGLLLLDFIDFSCTAPVVATHSAGAPRRKLTGLVFNLHGPQGETQERRFAGLNLSPDITRLVCNPITGQLFRLPDIDGTKKTKFCGHVGLLACSTHGHGPRLTSSPSQLSATGRSGAS